MVCKRKLLSSIAIAPQRIVPRKNVSLVKIVSEKIVIVGKRSRSKDEEKSTMQYMS